MKEVLHAPAPEPAHGGASAPWEGGPGTAEELARWPEDAEPGEARFAWQLALASVARPGRLRTPAGRERLLAVATEGELRIVRGAEGARSLRRGDVARVTGAGATRLEPSRPPVLLVDVLSNPARVRAELQLTRLGTRLLRERLVAPHAVLYALRGACVARVAGEEEPFELAPRESLWLRDLAGEDLELTGGQADCMVLLVQLSASGHR